MMKWLSGLNETKISKNNNSKLFFDLLIHGWINHDTLMIGDSIGCRKLFFPMVNNILLVSESAVPYVLSLYHCSFLTSNYLISTLFDFPTLCLLILTDFPLPFFPAIRLFNLDAETSEDFYTL